MKRLFGPYDVHCCLLGLFKIIFTLFFAWVFNLNFVFFTHFTNVSAFPQIHDAIYRIFIKYSIEHLIMVICLCGTTCVTLKSDKNRFSGTTGMICLATSKGLLFIGPPRTLCAANEAEVQTVQRTTVKLVLCICPQTIQLFILRYPSLTAHAQQTEQIINIIQKWREVTFKHKKKII